MGAYENPGAGRVPDKSLEINTAALASFSESFAKGMLLYAAKKEQLRKESVAETNRVQLIGNEIQDKAFVTRNDNYKKMQELGVPITQQFKDLTDVGLMGRGERGDKDYVMGSIEARTILRTDPGLNTKDKQHLQKIIDMSQNFQTNMVNNGGKIMTELALYTDTPPSQYNNNYRWAGRTQMEKRASQYTAAVLNNEQIPGAINTSKHVHPPNLQGTNILTVTTLIDPKKAGKHAQEYENEELYPRNKDGYIEFKWEKDLNAWGEGLLEPIEKIADNIKIFQDAGIFKENGSLVDSQYVGGTTGSLEKIKGLSAQGYSELKLEKIVDVPGWRDNPTYNAMVNAQAIGFLSESNESLSATLETPLGLGPNFDMERFRTGTPVKGKDKNDIMEVFANNRFQGKSWEPTELMQREFIKDQIFDKYETQKTNSFKRRPATQRDIDNGWAVINPNVEDRKTNEWIVYYDGKEKVVQSKGSTAYNPTPTATKWVEEYLKDPGARVRVNLEGFEDAKTNKAGDVEYTNEDKKLITLDMSDPAEVEKIANKIIKNDPGITSMPTAKRDVFINEIKKQLKKPTQNDIPQEETVYEKQFATINASVPDMEMEGFPTTFTTDWRGGNALEINKVMKKFRDDIGKEIIKVEDPKQFYDAMINYYKKDQPRIKKLFEGAVEEIILNKDGYYSKEIINKLKTVVLNS